MISRKREMIFLSLCNDKDDSSFPFSLAFLVSAMMTGDMGLWERVGNSLSFTWETLGTFFWDQFFLFFLIGIIIVWLLSAKQIKKVMRKKYVANFENEHNVEDPQFYLKYYKKVQYLDIFGFLFIFFLLTAYLLTKGGSLGVVLAVGIGSIIISFQSYLLSIASYFLIVSKYKVGDIVKVGDKGTVQGEILYIKTFYTGISGKNDKGESTGEFSLIPNNQIWLNPVTKLDLAQNAYTKVVLMIPYSSTIFPLPFDVFLEKVKTFLDQKLHVRHAGNVSYYKTYIGVKYKLDYSYDNDGKVQITVSFLVKRNKMILVKEQLFSYLESLKG